MTQEERLDYLIKAFCEDSGRYPYLKTEPSNRRKILRSLMNIRLPEPAPEELLTVQDEFLREEAKERGIVAPEEIPTIREQFGSERLQADRISVWQGDITRLGTDAIVNAANSRLLGCFIPCHGCIDNAIHSAAGIELREECQELMQAQQHPEPTGSAKITGAYNLPCRYVIHTVGPIINGVPDERDRKELASCYESCLALADEKQLKTIAFCCISTGEFHFPNDEAAKIAVKTVEKHLRHSKLERVIFNVFKEIDRDLYERILRQ